MTKTTRYYQHQELELQYVLSTLGYLIQDAPMVLAEVKNAHRKDASGKIIPCHLDSVANTSSIPWPIANLLGHKHTAETMAYSGPQRLEMLVRLFGPGTTLINLTEKHVIPYSFRIAATVTSTKDGNVRLGRKDFLKLWDLRLTNNSFSLIPEDPGLRSAVHSWLQKWNRLPAWILPRPIAKHETAPRCFISYSWDSTQHKDWVRSLAEKLQSKGVFVTLDQFDVRPGKNLKNFMETGICEADRVLLVCTPHYKSKADAGAGGVGYEKSIVTRELLAGTSSEDKIIPLLRNGSHDNSIPNYIKALVYADFRDDSEFDVSFEKLFYTIHNLPIFPRPPLGRVPKFLRKGPKHPLARLRPSGDVDRV